VVICLEQSADDLHMVQLMPLPPDYLCCAPDAGIFPHTAN